MWSSLGEITLDLYLPSSSLSSPVLAVFRQDSAQRDPEPSWQLLCSGDVHCDQARQSLLLNITAVFQHELEPSVTNSTSHVNSVCLFWTCSSLSSPNPQLLPSGSLPISETSTLSLFRSNFSTNAPFPPLMSHLKILSMFNFQSFSQPTLPVTSNLSPMPLKGFHAGPWAPSAASRPFCLLFPRLDTNITLSFLTWHQISNLHPLLNMCSLNKY